MIDEPHREHLEAAIAKLREDPLHPLGVRAVMDAFDLSEEEAEEQLASSYLLGLLP